MKYNYALQYINLIRALNVAAVGDHRVAIVHTSDFFRVPFFYDLEKIIGEAASGLCSYLSSSFETNEFIDPKNVTDATEMVKSILNADDIRKIRLAPIVIYVERNPIIYNRDYEDYFDGWLNLKRYPKQQFKMEEDCKPLIKMAYEKLSLSVPEINNIIEVAKTIAFMDNKTLVKPEHIAEAINYKSFNFKTQ